MTMHPDTRHPRAEPVGYDEYLIRDLTAQRNAAQHALVKMAREREDQSVGVLILVVLVALSSAFMTSVVWWALS